VTLSL